MMTDDSMKKMEFGSHQQQQQPPQEMDATTEKNLVEAVAVQVLDDGPQREQQERVVIQHHYIVSPGPSVRNNGDIQCCYPVSDRSPPVNAAANTRTHRVHVYLSRSTYCLLCIDIYLLCPISKLGYVRQIVSPQRRGLRRYIYLGALERQNRI